MFCTNTSMVVMSKQVKRVLILVLIAAVVIGIIALSISLLRHGKFPGAVDAWNEAVFSKTVNDFPGYMIDNLDAQDDTNFIVYAKNVRRVTAENGSNRLVETDAEALQYTFAEPDEQLTGLKRGDVFFIEPNEQNAYGLVVRVKRVRVKDDMAVIKGKDVRLTDLIEYADVEMDVPVNRFFLDSSDITEDLLVQATASQGVTASPLSLDRNATITPQGAIASTLALSAPEAAVPQDAAISTLALSTAETDAPDGTADPADGTTEIEPADTNVPFWLYELPMGEFTAMGSEISTGINGDWGPLHAEGRAGVRINSVHVVFKVRPALLAAVMSVQADCRAFLNGSLRAQTGGSLPIKLPSIIVPMAGPLVFTFTPGVSLDFTASVGTSVELSAGTRVAAEAIYMPVVNFVFRNPVFDVYDPSFTMQPTEIEGRVDLNVLQGTAEFGIPYVATLYKALSGGVSLEGTATAPDVFETPEAEPDSYHECRYCVDGDVYLQTRLDVGAALDLVNWFHKKRGEEPEAGGVVDFDGTPDENGETATMTGKDGDIYRFGDSKSFRITDWSWSIIDLRWDFPIEQYADFYVSLRDGHAPDFGWGECPHLLWRTDVTVKNTEGRKVSGALVTATDENGETRQAEVEKGKAVIYLPGGTSTLVCEKNILRDDCEVHINDAPAKAALTLEESRDLFIVCDFHELTFENGVWTSEGAVSRQLSLDAHPDVVQALRERYPEAKLMTKEEWTAEHPYGDDSFDLQYHVQKGLSLGDVIVVVDLFTPHNQCKGYLEHCECRGMIPGVQFYEFGVHIVLEHPKEYVTPRQQAFQYYQSYLHRTTSYLDEVNIQERIVTGHGADVYEHIPTGPFMDEEYQYNAEQAAENYMEHHISFPVGQMRSHDYNQRSAEFAEPITDYGLALLFPYVDELWHR